MSGWSSFLRSRKGNFGGGELGKRVFVKGERGGGGGGAGMLAAQFSVVFL